MPYKTGTWGVEAKKRNEKRLAYFREYQRLKKYGKNNAGAIRPETADGCFGENFALKLLNGSVLERKSSYDIK